MPNIGDQDLGPQGQEEPWQEAIRSELGRFTNRAWLDSNQDISVNVLDYIGQYAASYAILNAFVMQFNGPRATSMMWAKAWVTGFVEWYLNQGNVAIRDDVTRQPDFLVTAQQGHFLLACKEFPDIPWTHGNVNRNDSLWFSGFEDRSLERVNMNLKNCTVQEWDVTPMRAPMIGSLWLPRKCTSGGVQLGLGNEILSDWLYPPDADHGQPFTTLCKVYSAKKESDRITHPSDTQTRKTYIVLVPGGRWLIAVEDGVPPRIVTFFKKTS